MNLLKAQAWYKCYYNANKVDIDFSMGDKVLLFMEYLNVMGGRKLVPYFMGPFSIVQWVGPLVYWLNLGNHYS